MLDLPKDDVEKQSILTIIARKFDSGRQYGEEEVNNLIQTFEVEDFALFRRELVNFGYLGKDSHAGTYWLIKNELSEEELDKIRNRQGKIQKMDE